MNRSDLTSAGVAVLAGLALSTGALGQPCTPDWNVTTIPGFTYTGLPVPVAVSEFRRWDPDGAGPAEPLFVAGGLFNHAGTTPVQNIAAWDGSTWSGLGSGIGAGQVTCLETLPDGRLVAGGEFKTAGGVTVHSIGVWNGTAWTDLAGGLGPAFTPSAIDMVVMPNGDLIVGGEFSIGPTGSSHHISRFDGVQWNNMETGFSGQVNALVVMPDGTLIAGGKFTSDGAVTKPLNRVAKWNGSTWSALGTGLGASGNGVFVLHARPNGDLIAGGNFQNAGSLNTRLIARWDGTAWSAIHVEGITGNSVHELVTLNNGDLIAAGNFIWAGTTPAASIARWDGTDWFPLGAGTSGIPNNVTASLVLPDGFLAIGGSFDHAGGKPTQGMALWGCEAPPTCAADCDQSGTLTIDDFICFQTLFALSDPTADCDQSSTLTIDDFICFQTLFAIGC